MQQQHPELPLLGASVAPNGTDPVTRLEKELLMLYRGGAVLRRALVKACNLAHYQHIAVTDELRKIANADWEDLQKMEEKGVAP